jgi:hypothetical protein
VGDAGGVIVGRDVGCRGTTVVVLEGMTTHAGAEKTDGRDVLGGRKETQRRARVRARLGSTRMGRGNGGRWEMAGAMVKQCGRPRYVLIE